MQVPQFGAELRGLNMLALLFKGLTFDELIATAFAPEMQVLYASTDEGPSG
jgi:hypothetical protein